LELFKPKMIMAPNVWLSEQCFLRPQQTTLHVVNTIMKVTGLDLA